MQKSSHFSATLLAVTVIPERAREMQEVFLWQQCRHRKNDC
jgi:hypothetical protein